MRPMVKFIGTKNTDWASDNLMRLLCESQGSTYQRIASANIIGRLGAALDDHPD